MRQWKIWSGWQSTVMSTLSTSWDCCTGTAVCFCRMQNKPSTGWNWRQSEIYPKLNMRWENYISLTIRKSMTLMMASNGWSEQLETGTLTLPIVWAKNT